MSTNSAIGRPQATAVANSRRMEAVERKRRQMTNRFLFRLGLIVKMPIAWIAGMRIRKLNTSSCTTSIPFKWLSQNPFRSVYFATQAMAAELSAGALALLAVEARSPSVAMLITGFEAHYSKKANQTVFYTCEDGDRIFDAVDQAVSSGDGVEIKVTTVGRFADGTEVSRFTLTWSFKQRSAR